MSFFLRISIYLPVYLTNIGLIRKGICEILQRDGLSAYGRPRAQPNRTEPNRTELTLGGPTALIVQQEATGSQCLMLSCVNNDLYHEVKEACSQIYLHFFFLRFTRFCPRVCTFSTTVLHGEPKGHGRSYIFFVWWWWWGNDNTTFVRFNFFFI